MLRNNDSVLGWSLVTYLPFRGLFFVVRYGNILHTLMLAQGGIVVNSIRTKYDV